ncbi:hypothetical protein DVH05_017461 [Phytophthora capsici]|nr:hypothetical protein DVH05_017461 [Phytophthora capsici]
MARQEPTKADTPTDKTKEKLSARQLALTPPGGTGSRKRKLCSTNPITPKMVSVSNKRVCYSTESTTAIGHDYLLAQHTKINDHTDAYSTGEFQMGLHEHVIRLVDVREACRALKQKLAREKHGQRQYGRRLSCEPFRLSPSQKNMLATSYKAARYAGIAVDYTRMAESLHFSTFKGHADQLQALEKSLLDEMQAAMQEQRFIEASKCNGKSTSYATTIEMMITLHNRNYTRFLQRRTGSWVQVPQVMTSTLTYPQ